MRLQTRLLKRLERGWSVETPSSGFIEDPLTGNRIPEEPSRTQVAVAIQQRLLTQMSETGALSVVDERIALVVPPVEIPPTAVLRSPRGEVWNAKGKGIIRKRGNSTAVYTAVPVRRAKELDRP